MIVDSSCSIPRISFAMRPIHDEEPWATTTSLARVMTDDRTVVGLSTATKALVRAAEAAAVAAVVVIESIFEREKSTMEAPTRAHTGRLGAAHDASLDADWMALDKSSMDLIYSSGVAVLRRLQTVQLQAVSW